MAHFGPLQGLKTPVIDEKFIQFKVYIDRKIPNLEFAVMTGQSDLLIIRDVI